MVTERDKALLKEAVRAAVAIAYHGSEELRVAVEAATLAEALKRWEELAAVKKVSSANLFPKA